MKDTDEYLNEEIQNRLDNLYIDCPECESIIHSDDQYQCTTCGGSSQISVNKILKNSVERLEEEKKELIDLWDLIENVLQKHKQ